MRDTGQSFEVLVKLAKAAKETELGWITIDQTGPHDTYHQAIRRLKQDLQREGVDVERLIENAGTKQYRLSTPPQHITIEERAALL